MMGSDNPEKGEAPIIIGMADSAMHMYRAAIAALPDDHDADFHSRAEVILTGFRKLGERLTGARSRSGAPTRGDPRAQRSSSTVRRPDGTRRDRTGVHAGPAALRGAAPRQAFGAGDGQWSGRASCGPAGCSGKRRDPTRG